MQLPFILFMNAKNLKTAYFFNSLIVGLLLSLFMVSCKKDEVVNPSEEAVIKNNNTITGEIATNKEFTLLKSILFKTGMDKLLDAPGKFTLFAPNDSSFLVSGINQDIINELSVLSLKKILNYHTLPNRLFAADFKLGVYYNEVSLAGDSSFVVKNNEGIFVNGIKVAKEDMLQTNGIMHVVSKVLIPADGDFMKVISNDTSLSFLYAAILRTSTGNTNLAKTLSCGCKFTVFAPSNQAFREKGFNSIEDINTSDYTKITNLLSYHITKDRLFSSDCIGNKEVNMINGKKVEVFVNKDAFNIKGPSNLQFIQITKPNIMSTLGVMHKIDVLIE